jgi:outer membrane protein W
MTHSHFTLKPFFWSLLVLSFTVSAAQGSYSTRVQKSTSRHFYQPLLELKSSYLFFTQSPLRKIYKHGGFEESLSASFPLWKWLNLYTSIGVAYVKGKSLNNRQNTSLLQVPIDLGLKVIFPLHPKLDYYLSFGGRYAYLHQHNESLFIDKNIHKQCGGFFANSGFDIIANHHWLIGLFGQYAYTKTSIVSQKPNVFGQKGIRIDNATVGISIGYAF